MKLTGVGASEGVAVGPAFVYVPGERRPERESIPEGAVDRELKRFRTAVEAVVRKLSEISEKLQVSGSEEATIFGAHVEIAEDPELNSGVEERVRSLETPEAAVLAVGAEFAEVISAMEDEYLAARADDVRDVAHQFASELMRGTAAGLEALEILSIDRLARRKCRKRWFLRLCRIFVTLGFSPDKVESCMTLFRRLLNLQNSFYVDSVLQPII